MTYQINNPEDKARHDLINPALEKSGWKVQHFKTANIYATKGVAVEYFQMGKGVGEADYVLFVNGKACGIVEAKKEGMITMLEDGIFKAASQMTSLEEVLRVISE